MNEEVLPQRTTVLFTHAVAQFIADEVGADVLHIKGPAVESNALALGALPTDPVRTSVDADVLVRPAHIPLMLQGLTRHGWTLLYDFSGGSPFRHAATLGREGLANVDVHRYFPGIELEPEAAFSRLWEDRRSLTIAAQRIHVPSLLAQRLILILHAARSPAFDLTKEARAPWVSADPETRGDLARLAADLNADVAFRAATGGLDLVRNEPSHDLWAALSTGEASQVRLWGARVRAARGWRESVRTGVSLLAPNTGRMASRIGRPLNGGELLRAYVEQARRGVRALLKETHHADAPPGDRK